MPWYLNIRDLFDVRDFTNYLANQAGHDWKKIMPELLRIRQVQLKNDQIRGTWQNKTPEGKIAELLCTYGHGRTATSRNADGTTTQVERSKFHQDIQKALGQWLPTVIEAAVAETDRDPASPKSPRDPQYFAVAATKIANNRAIKALGPITNNTSIDLILQLMGTVADTCDPPLEEYYVQYRRYAAQLAAKQYEEEVAGRDKAKLDKTAIKTIKNMRDHQKMKLDGSGFKGAHESGKFWLLGRAIDGMPILLVSSKEETDIKPAFISQATSLASGSNPGICTGSYLQDKKAGRITFSVEHGQTQTPVLASALSSIGVRRESVASLPAGRSAWAASTAPVSPRLG